jgi:hypothetical protein
MHGGLQLELRGLDAEGVQAEPVPHPQVPGACLQGCLGQGDGHQQQPSNVTINIGGKLEVTDKKGKLDLVHNFQAKIMLYKVEQSRLIRRDIIMESLAPYLQYHTKEQVKIRLEFLMLQFPNYAPLILTLYQDHK